MLAIIIIAEGLTAFCALGFEIAMARLVAPHAGMSTDTWTAIIAAFLLALALGHMIGGHLAARASTSWMLTLTSCALLGGSAAVALTPFIMAEWDALILAPAPSQLWRIVVFAALPCIPAGLLLGIATPLLMTAALATTHHRSRVIGAVYAAGAAGSVCGVLATLWLLLDTLGTQATILTIGAIAFANATLIGAIMTRRRVATS